MIPAPAPLPVRAPEITFTRVLAVSWFIPIRDGCADDSRAVPLVQFAQRPA